MKPLAVVLILASAVWVEAARAQELVLVEDGISKAPVVVAENAPPATVQAAEELGGYMERISGSRPRLLRGVPDPKPDRAIWIGAHPSVAALFPDLSFDFRHPEEVLIACNGRHVVIAGRDRMAGDTRTEHGTANAVYTFLQKHLGVRYLWPGEPGLDVPKNETIALPAFVFRYHPQFLQRDTLMKWAYRFYKGELRNDAEAWGRFQRIYWGSLNVQGGHGFTDWWEKYHEEHPDYFALQPDGTRSGFPKPHYAKLCQSNPRVWAQWIEEVRQDLREKPAKMVFAASPNDGYNSGICVCERCRTWDHPKGQPWSYRWKDSRQDYVAMTDRYVTFWNHLARALRQSFPDRRLYVAGSAYGPATPPPVEAVPRENVVIKYVGHFPLTTEESRQQQKAQWKAWAEKAPTLIYRPNLWYWSGGVWGLPEVAMQKTIEDFRFLAQNSCVGITVDMTWGHWATQGPQYYVMAQLAWDPLQDGRALLQDYYRRGFGGAAEQIAAYWHLMEQARDAVVAFPDFGLGSRNRTRVPGVFAQVYTPDFLDRAEGLLQRAAAEVEDGPEKYRKRVAFVRSGFDYTRLMMQNIPLMKRVRESGGKDAAAVRQVIANWEAIEKVAEQADRMAIRYWILRTRLHGDGYMGGMGDYFGPPSEEFRKAAGLK